MNASALLTSQGWLGPGHALDARLTDYGAQTYKQKGQRGLAYDPHAQKSSSHTSQLATGNGLIRPLLVSQRHGSKHGIGKKSHEPASGSEWWLKGFASALANVGKSESERSSAVSSGTSTPRNGLTNGYVGKHSGLYSYFTSGTVMQGTIESPNQQDSGPEQSNESSQVAEANNTRKTKKRKSDVLEEESEANGTIINPLAVSPVKKPQTTQDLESSIPYLTERDKSRKKSHKHAKSSDIEAFAVIGSFLGAANPDRPPKPQINSTTHDADDENEIRYIPQDTSARETREETKEERTARRRRRKEGKEREKINNNSKKGLTLAQMVEEELAKLSSMDNSEVDGGDSDGVVQQENSRNVRRKKRRERDGKSGT